MAQASGERFSTSSALCFATLKEMREKAAINAARFLLSALQCWMCGEETSITDAGHHLKDDAFKL